jgi:hypothetical protein
MMANEINKLVEEFDYSCILPLSCAFFCKNCKERNCYTGLTFITQHDKKNDDQSKLTFRVLAHSEFTNKVLAKIEKKEFYEVNYNSWAKPICENGKLVSYKKSSSAFKITNDNHVE